MAFAGFDPVTFAPQIVRTESFVKCEVKDLYALGVVPIGSVDATVATVAGPGL